MGPVGPATLYAIVVTRCDSVLLRIRNWAVGVVAGVTACTYTFNNSRLDALASVANGTKRSYSSRDAVVEVTGVPEL